MLNGKAKAAAINQIVASYGRKIGEAEKTGSACE
jgi:hypothetical protein